MPDRGHCSSAVTSASCASSSARPMSRTILVRAAMSFADSIRQIASMARAGSEAVTAPDQSVIRSQRKRCLRPRALRLNSLAKLVPLLSKLARGIALGKVVRLVHRANLKHCIVTHPGGTSTKWRAREPLDRLLHRLYLPQPEPRDQFLGLGERPVDYSPLAPSELDALAPLARMEPLACEHHARLHQLFIEVLHVG